MVKRSKSFGGNVEESPKKKKPMIGTLDLEALEQENYEVWILKAPASLEINKIHDTSFERLTANPEIPYTVKTTKKKSTLPIVIPKAKNGAQAVNLAIRGEINIFEDVSDEIENKEPVKIKLDIPKKVPFPKRHPRFLPSEVKVKEEPLEVEKSPKKKHKKKKIK